MLSPEFPSVFKILDLIKEYAKHLPWYNKYKPHAVLAVLLQLIESTLFIDTICKRISVIYPLLPIFTIHDNILTIQGEEEKVKRIIEEVFDEYVGRKPTINIDSC